MGSVVVVVEVDVGLFFCRLHVSRIVAWDFRMTSSASRIQLPPPSQWTQCNGKD